MNRDDIIRMAREAGSIDSEDVIETVYAAFTAAEREACAKFFDLNDTNLFWGSQAAQHIRARGQN